MIFSSLKPFFSRFILLILWGVGSLLLVQCDKDEDLLPALRTDLLLVRTDAQGRVMQLITDEGEILFPSQPISGGRTDTTYRVLAVYHRHEASAQVEVRHLPLLQCSWTRSNNKMLPSNYCRCGKVRLFSISVSAFPKVFTDSTPSDGHTVASPSRLMDTAYFVCNSITMRMPIAMIIMKMPISPAHFSHSRNGSLQDATASS